MDSHFSSEKGGVTIERRMTYFETLIHLLKGNVGAGLFAMGDAFKNSGIVVGFFGTLFIGFICIYNNHTLVRCATAIIEKKGLKEPPTFPETISYSFENGPKIFKSLSTQIKRIVKIFILVTQLGFCVVYIAFVGQSLKEVVENHLDGINLNVRAYMIMVFPLITLASLIRTLKFLTPISFLSNACLIYGVIAVFICIIKDGTFPINERKFVQSVDKWPLFIGTIVFAFEGIALTIPLRNEMNKSEQFDSKFGVLNVGMALIMTMLLSLGLLAYLNFGDEVHGSVTFNLGKDLLAETVKSAVGIGIMLTYPLQFYVAAKIIKMDVDDIWGPFKHDHCMESSERVILIILTFIFALVVPHIDAVVSLIGVLCSNALALLLPALSDYCLRYGSEPILEKNWCRTVMNSLAILLSFIAMIAGSYVSVKNMIDLIVEDFRNAS
ncbi:proton-coupled amino acid transporter 1 [Halyomorpha halys]|uniref:proton-coupled amino acid transporter 1 n=1 Tax=Halyomorpha halys TaxID=286706 RepID=UPI0006D4DD96|nr:proton-coupled amino acid transporter 1-like [Halyomorpha halys]KAE8574065.1 hypothetical protein A483_HHAL011682 [Halyomorpha halys]